MTFKKVSFKLINNTVFVRAMENVRKDGDIKLATTERRRIYFVSEPNHHNKKLFYRKLSSNSNEKKEILINKPVYLGLSIL